MSKNGNRKTLATLSLLAALAIASLVPGCVSKTTKVENGSVSLGQQLQDLDKAKQTGAINEKEYQKLRKALIEKYK